MPDPANPLHRWQWAADLDDLSPGAKAVLLNLALRDGESHAHPGNAKLARESSISTRSVVRALAELTRKKHVALVEEGSGRQANVYRITPSSDSPSLLRTPSSDTQSVVTTRELQ